jgi:hypothetical protein
MTLESHLIRHADQRPRTNAFIKALPEDRKNSAANGGDNVGAPHYINTKAV